jgi:hypothetical protein
LRQVSGDMTYRCSFSLYVFRCLRKVDRVFPEIFSLFLKRLPECGNIHISRRYTLFQGECCPGAGGLSPVHAGHHTAAGSGFVRHVCHGNRLAGNKESVHVLRQQAPVGYAEYRLEVGVFFHLADVFLIALAAVRWVHYPALVIGYRYVRPGNRYQRDIIVGCLSLVDIIACQYVLANDTPGVLQADTVGYVQQITRFESGNSL